MYIAVQAMHTSVELHHRVKIKEFIYVYICAGMGDKNDSCLFYESCTALENPVLSSLTSITCKLVNETLLREKLQSFQDLMVMLKDELGVNKCLLYIL